MKNIIKFIRENKIIRFIYNLFRASIFIVLATYLAFILFQRFSGNADIFGYRIFTVASGSMTPAYNVYDVIYVKEIDPKDLKIGDDIAYRGERAGFEGLIITHRIIDIEASSDGKIRIFTQGINNKDEDPSISSDQVLGKVYGKVFFINTLNHIIKSTWGFFFLIFLPLTLVIVLEIIETVIESKIDNNKIRKYSLDDEDDNDYEYDEEDDENEDFVEVEKIFVDDKKENIIEEPSMVEEGEEEDEEII